MGEGVEGAKTTAVEVDKELGQKWRGGRRGQRAFENERG